MGGAIVCLSCRFARLGSRSAKGEGHTVRGAIGLVVIAVLVVDHALLGLAALHLAMANRNKSNAVSCIKLQPAKRGGTRSERVKVQFITLSQDALDRFSSSVKCLFNPVTVYVTFTTITMQLQYNARGLQKMLTVRVLTAAGLAATA